MTTILLDRVRKTFNDRLTEEPIPVLKSVSLRVVGPSIVSLVGPNGVGKTTILRLLAGLLQPDEGTVTIDGSEPLKCRIGYVPQSNPVFPWRRVVDDIAIPMEILGVLGEERRAHVAKLVKQFSFDLPLNSRTFCLSGGQRQLVNICRALVGPEPPKLLLLDEPFASLDPVARDEFLAHLQRIRMELPLVIFVTTHQLDYAVLTSDLILPFRNRPVAFSTNDGVRVELTYPRSVQTRTQAEFQATLERLEKSFQRNLCKGTLL